MLKLSFPVLIYRKQSKIQNFWKYPNHLIDIFVEHPVESLGTIWFMNTTLKHLLISRDCLKNLTGRFCCLTFLKLQMFVGLARKRLTQIYIHSPLWYVIILWYSLFQNVWCHTEAKLLLGETFELEDKFLKPSLPVRI